MADALAGGRTSLRFRISILFVYLHLMLVLRLLSWFGRLLMITSVHVDHFWVWLSDVVFLMAMMILFGSGTV